MIGWRARAGFLALLGAVSLAAVAFADGPQKPTDKTATPPPPPASPKKTLQRTEDYVVLTGADLPRLTGRLKTQLRAYALTNGVLAPIPFQVDEKNAEGGYCWEKGDPIIEDEDKGVFDANDELLFMGRDAGDKADERLLPTNCDGWHEVELEDPLTKTKGWVYLCKLYGRPGPISAKRYVSFSRDENGVCIWRGEKFLGSNAKTPENACRATILKFAPSGTLEPEKGESIIDCSKVQLDAYWTFIHITRNSADVRIQIGGYIEGAIRLLAQNVCEVKLALGIWISAPDSLITLYANCTTMPTNVKLPVSLNESDPSGYKLPIDLSQRAKGWKFFNDRNPKPVTIDGKMDEDEKKLDLTFPSWNCVFGPEGGLITRFVLDPRAVRPTNKLLYCDDLTQAIEPEFEAGSWGSFGYYCDLSGMKSATYSGNYVIFYCAPPFRPGSEKQYLDTLDAPLKKTIRGSS